MSLRGILGINLDNALDAGNPNEKEHIFGFLRDEKLKTIKVKVQNVRIFGNLKVVDFSFENDVQFFKILSYENKEKQMFVVGDSVFEDNEQQTHIFYQMEQCKQENNKKIINDVEVRKASKKDGNHIFYVWD